MQHDITYCYLHPGFDPNLCCRSLRCNPFCPTDLSNIRCAPFTSMAPAEPEWSFKQTCRAFHKLNLCGSDMRTFSSRPLPLPIDLAVTTPLKEEYPRVCHVPSTDIPVSVTLISSFFVLFLILLHAFCMYWCATNLTTLGMVEIILSAVIGFGMFIRDVNFLAALYPWPNERIVYTSLLHQNIVGKNCGCKKVLNISTITLDTKLFTKLSFFYF